MTGSNFNRGGDAADIITDLPDNVRELITRADGLTVEQMATLIRVLIAAPGRIDQFKSVLDALELSTTTSAFDDREKIKILERVMTKYHFRDYLEKMGIKPNDAMRADIIKYWESFMELTEVHGLSTGGIIDPKAQTSLWKATSRLAGKMQQNAAQYNNLPPLSANHAIQVQKTLADLEAPRPFLEILTGEAWEDMVKSPRFISGFQTHESSSKDPIDIQSDTIHQVRMVLNRRKATSS